TTYRRYAMIEGTAPDPAHPTGPRPPRKGGTMAATPFTFEVSMHSSAPAHALFAAISDARTWEQWAKPVVLRSFFERRGEPAPGGVGAVRALGLKPILIKEEVTEHVEGRRHGYKLITPSPMRDYTGLVELTSTDSGTDIRWSGRFSERIPGTGPALRSAMRALIKLFAGKVVRYVEQRC
ncbi:MAG: SRPBCC family protein, partial [Sciscionella sp.]